MTSRRISDEEHQRNVKIYIHARNRNLLWRYEILNANNLNATDYIEQMDDDIAWDTSESDIELECTKSFKLTGLPLKYLPDTLSTPITSQIVDFSHNQLEVISPTFFQNIPEVRILRLANNNLESIPWQGLSQLKKLRVIDMRHNPWDKHFLTKFHSYIRMFHPNLQQLFI